MLWNQRKLLRGLSLQKHTEYHILGLLGFLNSHMMNLAVGEILLSLKMMLLTGSLIRLPGRTILSHVAWQSTLETCTKSLTSLRGDILLVWGYRTRNLLYTLLGLLHNWSSYLLLGMEHLIPEMLHLKVGMLHRDLGTLVLELQTWNLHRCMAQTQGSNKLTG
jgi:hypothetical protein